MNLWILRTVVLLFIISYINARRKKYLFGREPHFFRHKTTIKDNDIICNREQIDCFEQCRNNKESKQYCLNECCKIQLDSKWPKTHISKKVKNKY